MADKLTETVEHVGSYRCDGGMIDHWDCSCGWTSGPFFDGAEYAQADWERHVAECAALTPAEVGRPPDRPVAQFFFEVGYGAAYAEALIRNDMKPPFELTDALIERAWEIAGEAHEDPAEFDHYLALSRPNVDEPSDELIDRIMQAVCDPGCFVGFKGEDRTLNEWQRDALRAALGSAS